MIRFMNKADTFRIQSMDGGKLWKLTVRCSMACSRALSKEELIEFKEVLEKAIAACDSAGQGSDHIQDKN